MRRALRIVSGLLIFLAIVLPGAALYYTVFTPGGLQCLVARMPHRIGSTRLTIVNVTGTLAYGIRVERLEVEHERVHLRIEGIEGRVALLPLLWQTIRTRDAVIGSIYVEVRRRTHPVEKSPPIFVPRWLMVSADHTHVGTALVVAPNGYRLEARNLLASGVARHRSIRFFEASLQMGDMSFQGTGELRARDPLQIEADGRIGWTAPGQPAWSLAAGAHGDLNSLALTARFTAPFSADFTGHALDLTNHWHWLGNAQVHSFDLATWNLNGPLGILTAQLQGQGDAQGFSAHGPVVSAGLHAGAFAGRFDGFYSDKVLTARRIELVHEATGALATGSGTIRIVPNGPELDLRGTWKDFRWPLVGKQVAFRTASGEYSLDGILPYTVHARGVANIAPFAPIPIDLHGHLAKDHLEFSDTDVGAFGGHALIAGSLAWSPQERWSIQGDVSGLNTALIREDLPGSLNFSAVMEGRGFSAPGAFEARLHNLSGRLRAVPASGGGNFSHSPQGWKFDKVNVGLGRTRIALDGAAGEQMDLRFAIQAEDLGLIAAGSRGQLQASGTVRGTWRDPTVVASARGSGIHHEGLTVAGFEADIDFDPRPHHESKVVARVQDLQHENRKLDRLFFSLAGPPDGLAVRLEAHTRGLGVVVQGSGPYSHGQWNGEITRLAVNGDEPLHLELEQASALLISADHVHGDWMCLVGTPASLCADGDWTAARWSTTLTASDLPLATLTSGLTRSVEYTGALNGLVRMSGGAGDPPQGSVRLDLADAHIIHRLSSGKTENTTVGSGVVNVSATRATIRAEVSMDAGDIGGIKGSLTAQRTTPQWQNMPVEGDVHAHTGELGLATLYIPEIDRATGRLNADVQLAGTLGAPRVQGSMRLSGGEIDFYQVNLGLRQARFEALLNEGGLDFSGTTRIGQGTATAQGHLEWRDTLPYGRFQLQGTGLRVVDVPEAHVDASPDLTFRIDGRRIDVSGTVRVPYARMIPVELKGAVLSSSDEVIVGQEHDDPAKRFQVTSNITLNLGEKVTIETSGLSGRLAGNLNVRSGNDQVTRGTGELSIEEGKYSAYARKLDIQRGRLIFTGGPIQDPGVDLRAIKVFPDVTAGINVRGTLQQPRISFFSDPPLPQSRIVSLVLAGGGLESVQNQKSGAGNEALAQGGAILAQQLGSRIGIEDVSLETDLANVTSLVVGKFLSPRLYVSYGVSLTQQLNTLKLRYTLGDHWTVKTEVGQARGADLVFTLDK